MTEPTGGSRPLASDPTAAFPTAPPPGPPAGPPPGVPAGRDVPARRDVQRVARPVPAAAPAAAGAVPLTPRDRDGRDTDERRRRKAPLAWLPWALLAALLALLALMLLAGTLAGAERAVQGAGSSGGSAAAGSGAGGEQAAGAGTLTAGDVDLLASPEALGRLGSLQGQPAVGRGVLVESVVADEGFWVGSSAQQRTFVYLTEEARQSAGESGYQVEKGQQVDLNGTVTRLGQGDPERFGVTDAEGARQLGQQRAYVRASQVRLSES